MTKNVQIPAGEDTYIQAIHSRPTEDSSAEWDSLLVIMLHDFPGSRNSKGNIFHDLEFLLRDKGYHTLRFDFRGCGESGGREEEFTLAVAGEDFQAALGWARENGYRRFIMIGEGLGAGVLLMNPVPATLCAILLWPMIDFPLIARTAFNTDDVEPDSAGASYITLSGHRIGLGLLHELYYTDIRPYLEKPQCATLVMHGVMDEIAPIDQLELLREDTANFQRLEITTFQDGAHGLLHLNHRKAMYFHIGQFIEKYT